MRTLLMAVACGVGVANAYFPQAISPLLARDLHLSEGAAATAVTAVQLGYAAGIFFLVPLGDRLPRRPLVAGLFGAVAVALLLAGTARSLAPLLVFGALTGAVTVVPQLLIPMAADLAEPARAGRAVAALQGGLLAGVLLARAFGGVLGQALGWRAPYIAAAGLAAVLAVALLVALPRMRPNADESYPRLLGSGLRLLRTVPQLRRSAAYQALAFGAFTAAWTSIALLLTGPRFGLGTGAVGVVALVGAGSVVAVPAAGRLVDRRGPDRLSALCFAGLGAAAVVLLAGELANAKLALAGLVAGMLLLDVTVQSSQVANQARIFAAAPGARSRINGVYMTAVFLGGSAGSWLGARAYLALGWTAVCGLVALAAGLAALRHATAAVDARQQVADRV
ncbi:MFS transporter [Dactylosporangium darangshiense]|uniref:MFS transporter n=1 Tax=Dactylosporangium darangshiense TaxID=579108 RepID=A0ABP8D8W7_9ACTN